MDEINNFGTLGRYLFDVRKPLTDDQFYFLQILVRGKDGNKVNSNNKNRLVKYYAIKSKDQFFKLQDEIKAICKATNARAYIHTTRRSFKGVANKALENTVHSFVSNEWIGIMRAYSSAAGQTYVSSDKQFVVDLDGFTEEQVNKVILFINSLRGKQDEYGKIVQQTIQTLNGYHLITNAFDTSVFKKFYKDIDIHKNNPTLLYYSPIE